MHPGDSSELLGCAHERPGGSARERARTFVSPCAPSPARRFVLCASVAFGVEPYRPCNATLQPEPTSSISHHVVAQTKYDPWECEAEMTNGAFG
eukprot:6174479-Pleurochrysis_carterae.AAC.3